MRLLKNLPANEKGIALPLVLVLLVIMTLFSITAMDIAQGNTNMVSRFLGGEKAIYAAEQGYNQYLWKLNNNSTFYTDTAKYNCDTTSESNYYIYTPIDKSADEANNFRVQIRVPLVIVDPSTTKPASNRVIIRSTGWNSKDDTQQRTIEVEVLCHSYTPIYAVVSGSDKASDGDEVIWYDGDKVYGPIHSNDTVFIDDQGIFGTPTFYDLVTYYNGIKVRRGLGSWESTPAILNNPNIFHKGHMKGRKINMPGTAQLAELKAVAKTMDTYYNGRTCIYLKGNTYDVRYYDRDTGNWYYNNQRYRMVAKVPAGEGDGAVILSEWLNEASAAPDGVLYETLNDDGTVKASYNSFTAMKAACPSSLSLPENGVIFVDGLQNDGSHPYDSAIAGKFNPEMGNLFVHGRLSGRLTIASANDIYITGYNPTDWRHPDHITDFNSPEYPPGITYADTTYVLVWDGSEWVRTDVTGSDMLGLMARRNVHTLHWNWPSQISYQVRSSVTQSSERKDRFCFNWGKKMTKLREPGAFWWVSIIESFNNLITYDAAPENITIQGAVVASTGSFGYETNYTDWANLKSQLEGFVSGFPVLGDRVSKEQMTILGSVNQNLREHTTKPLRWNDLVPKPDWVAGYKTDYILDTRLLNEQPPHLTPSAGSGGWYSRHWEEVTTHVPK